MQVTGSRVRGRARREGRGARMNDLAPLYQQIYEDIKGKIEGGTYAEGDRIPSEQELCSAYGASRITVRRAISDLCTNGYLVKRQGVGTFVSKPRIFRELRRSGNRIETFTDICRNCGAQAGARLLCRRIVPARSDERAFLGLGENDLLLYVQRLRTADGVPVYEENVFLPYEEFRGLAEITLDDISLFDAIDQVSGRRPVRNARLTLEAVAASPEQASRLRVPAGAPLLYMNAYFEDAEGRPVAIGRQYYVGSRYAFDV